MVLGVTTELPLRRLVVTGMLPSFVVLFLFEESGQCIQQSMAPRAHVSYCACA